MSKLSSLLIPAKQSADKRPHHLHDRLGLEHILVSEVMGPVWREERRLYSSHLGKEAIRTQYRPDIEEQAQVYVLRSLSETANSTTDYEG